MPVAEHPAECDRVETAIVLENEERRYVADLTIGEGCALLRRQGQRDHARRQSHQESSHMQGRYVTRSDFHPVYVNNSVKKTVKRGVN